MRDGIVRRLIETDEMPIGLISEHARHDQNVRRGHLHTLHVWWATRPLAACRAVLLATLLPDPADEACPEAFREQARAALQWMSSRDLVDSLELRRVLLDFIAQFAAWENAHNSLFVETARRLVAAAHPDGPPLVVDPFAGIGSIPFEALRIGADAFAGDLNPVAVLLNKVALEYLPAYGLRLADAVRRWGQWVRERAMEELGPYYPTEPDGSIPLAYIWARTIRCEGPGCGAEVPLVGLLWLAQNRKPRVALRYHADTVNKQVVFELFEPTSERELQPPIVRRFAATCPVCGYTIPRRRVREQLRSRQGGTQDARLIVVITLNPDNNERGYRLATARDVAVAQLAAEDLSRRQTQHDGRLSLVPNEPTLHYSVFVNRAPIYGIPNWGAFFLPRQALALTTFTRLVRDSYQQVLNETSDIIFTRAVITCLSLAVSNLVHYLTSVSIYAQDHMVSIYIQGSGIPMRPDFAESNPLAPRLVGGFDYALSQIVSVLQREASQRLSAGTVQQGSATSIPLPDESVPYVVMDPPYYYTIQYADNSDLLYVWLKRILYDIHPSLFIDKLTPKKEEIIVQSPSEPSGEGYKNSTFYERQMQRALAECRRILQPRGLCVVLFAHKDTAGWEALLNALIRAGWTVTASWPIETERRARLRAGFQAMLATSVFLVCRPRPEHAGVGEWRQVLSEMQQRVAEWLPRLEREGIHGADAIFACIGPALEVYSRYDRVETAAGEIVPLGDGPDGRRGYLSYVWEAVAREALRVIFPEADPSGFEEDARLTAMWLWTVREKANGKPATEPIEEDLDDTEVESQKAKGYTLPYDDARLMIQALGIEEAHLTRPGGILEVHGNKARLLSVAERRRYLLGQPESGPPRRRTGRRQQLGLFEEPQATHESPVPVEPGRSTLDRLHQAMLLFADGQGEALRRLLVDEGIGRDGQFWRLADALSRLYPLTAPEKRWVDGLLVRKKSLGL